MVGEFDRALNPISVREDLQRKVAAKDEQDRLACEERGGRWISDTKQCIMPPPKPQPGDVLRDSETGEVKGFFDSKGQRVGARQEDVEKVVAKRNRKLSPIEGEVSFNKRAEAQRTAAANLELAEGVGSFQRLDVDPTGLDFQGAQQAAIIDAVPRALTLAGGAAIAGATAGLATGGTASVPLAISAAGVTFIGTIASSMISEFKSQRRDTTTAQQRVLDEGKQTLQDWATLAAADPANKARYLGEFNKQLALIDQARRQMKLDTSRDSAKFERAIPNLAEFEAFYSEGGERDVLVTDMQNSLLGLQDGQTVDYRMLQLTNRRADGSNS